jgi:integrase
MAKVAKRRGRYVLDYYDQHGERHRETLPAGTLKKQADERLREIVELVSRRTYIPNNKIPLFSEVVEDWLEFKKPNLRASTWGCYEGITRLHFIEFQNIRIDRITTAMVEGYISARLDKKMPLGTIRKNLVVLSQIFKYAVRHSYIEANPVTNAERPRGQGQETGPTIRVLTPKEINSLIGAVKDQKYRTLVMLAILSGARQGEILGLKWSDIDWDNRQVHIQRTFNMQRWYETKTKTSNRKIDLSRSMIQELKRWQLACPPNRLNLVFPTGGGGPTNHNNLVNRYFLPALKKAGIEKIRFHDLRHTYASLLIDQGENIKYIQKQLGHSSPTVTLNVYAHLMRPVNHEAMDRLENTLFGDTGHKPVTRQRNN